MSIRNLGFRDLQYVVAVAEHQSFSRAAEACAITQPALSERIKRIEFTLDVELFERTKRSLTVTAVGERLVARARALLQDAVEIDGMLTASREYPAVELILREGLTEPLLATLQAGDLDVVIAAAPLHAPGMTQLALFDEPFVLAVPIEHPLAQRPVVHATDLRGDEMVLLDDGHCLSGQALDVCPAKQRHNQNRLHAMSLETLRHMVAAGAGYSLMPALAVGRKPALSKLIRYKKLGGKRQYGRKLVLAWRKSFSRDADVRLLATLIRACLPTEMVAAA